MKKITLEKKEISNFVKNKKIVINQNSSIEFYDDEIIYNNNGEIGYAKSINIEFDDTKPTDNFIQELICNHFNIDKTQVIMITSYPENAEFKIRFTPDKEITIIICPITTAISNTQILMEEDKTKIDYKSSQIGLYRRLSNSCYFFRIDKD